MATKSFTTEYKFTAKSVANLLKAMKQLNEYYLLIVSNYIHKNNYLNILTYAAISGVFLLKAILIF
ncbi:hypothetical protein BU021_02495 [Staphylococcus simulans]|uniref:hypothetical protein n=1 Tax=Staphylococcus simulans TaxID=1286 RepID=UPI000D1F3647|nr:hypothetical protein [Staphylococcus simulans]PTJ41348.1 hypothetical protein BU021_02495 [Staphylococcus simulans]